MAMDEVERMSEERYLIQDTRSYCGNAVMWWCVGRKGYTTDIDKAGRYSLGEATAITRSRGTDRAWPEYMIEKQAFRIFDMQNLPKEPHHGK